MLVFLPQIAILFLCLSVLEDSGYMARAAFLTDRFLRKLGLSQVVYTDAYGLRLYYSGCHGRQGPRKMLTSAV